MTGNPLAIATSFDYGLPLAAQLPLIAAAGFSHVALGAAAEHSGYLSAAGRGRLAALLRQHRLQLDTLHGPPLDAPGGVASLAAAARAAVELGARAVVCHAGPFEFPAAELDRRLAATLAAGRELEGAAPAGVAFALENVLPGPASELVGRALAELDPARFGLCYDSAHEQIGGPHPCELLAELEDRLIAVHLSDRVRDFVDHVLPGEGFVDWTDVARALRRAAFAGPLCLEVATTHSAEKEPGRFLALAGERARWLRALVGGPSGPAGPAGDAGLG